MTISFYIQPRWDEHIKDVQERWSKSKAKSGSENAILLIVHTYRDYNPKEFSRWIEIERDGGGVLFISGAPGDEEANLKDQLLKQCPGLKEWPLRWHVLKTNVVGQNAGPELAERFERFLSSCVGLEGGEALPWRELYPIGVGENILAMYLWCLAEPRLSEAEVEANDDLICIESDAWGEMCDLKSGYGIEIPARGVLKSCRMLDPKGCQEFIRWVKGEALHCLAKVSS